MDFALAINEFYLQAGNALPKITQKIYEKRANR